MIITVDAPPKSDQIQHLFLIKTCQKLVIEEKFLSLTLGKYRAMVES